MNQFAHLLNVIQGHRYPEKNTALVQISFKLGLRVQEIALLQIKDVAEHGPETSGQRLFKLKEILALPAAYTKGADALKRSKSTYQRRRISFSVHDFHQLVQRIETMAKVGAEIKPEDFYPEVKKHRGNSRDLPMNDIARRAAIENHLAIRLAAQPSLKKDRSPILDSKGLAARFLSARPFGFPHETVRRRWRGSSLTETGSDFLR